MYMTSHNYRVWVSKVDFQFFEQITASSSDKRITVFQENGHQYCGYLKEGKKHDKQGRLWFDEFVYQGPFVNDIKKGYATVQSKVKQEDGTSLYNFEGMFKDDKKEGEGQLIIQGAKSKGTAMKVTEKYSGYFSRDQFHGSGVHVNEKGDVYDGEFLYGKK